MLAIDRASRGLAGDIAGRMPGGARAVARCDELGGAPYSDAPDLLFRGWLTPAFARTQERVAAWMVEAGMRVALDGASNLVGRYEGVDPAAPALLIGSHLDSVRDAGRYDGPLGVMLGIECVAALSATGGRPPFAIEVIAFGDEEGSRFPAAMLTSRAVAGTLDPAMLEVADVDGMTVAEALLRHASEGWHRIEGGAPALGAIPASAGMTNLASAARPPGSVLAYLEAHIEQGPVLEAERLPVGAVTGIAAQKRFAVTVSGGAGHAGTTPMRLRHDALAAAAAMVLAIEAIARDGPADLVATVGRFEVSPGAANVVPGRVAFSLDVRAGGNATRDAAAARMIAACERLAHARGVGVTAELLQDFAFSACDPGLVDLIDAAIAGRGVAPLRLVSGAGHDAMVMAALCPTAMLFVRCRGGVSHNPAEHVEPADADVALQVMLDVIDRLGAAHGA